jgi:hypothetical protein
MHDARFAAFKNSVGGWDISPDKPQAQAAA